MSRFGRASALAVLAAGVFAAISPSAAPAKRMTTEPGVIYKVPVTLEGTKGRRIAKDQFWRNGKSRWPRGAVIQYVITNKTDSTKALQIWNSRSAPIQPGKSKVVLMLWIYRGNFAYYMLSHGKRFGEKARVTTSDTHDGFSSRSTLNGAGRRWSVDRRRPRVFGGRDRCHPKVVTACSTGVTGRSPA